MNSKPVYKTKILQGHSRPIKDIKFSSNGEHIFSACADRNVIKWDYKTNTKLFTYPHQASVNVICVENSNKVMLTGDSTGCIYIWDIVNNVLLRKIEFDPSFNIRSIQFSSDDIHVGIVLATRTKGGKSFAHAYHGSKILENTSTSRDQAAEDNTAGNNDKEKDKEDESIYTIDSKAQKNKKKKDDTKPVALSQEDNGRVPINADKTPPETFKTFECKDTDTKYVQAKFTNYNKSIIISREDGAIEMINFENSHQISIDKFHTDIILDFDIDFEQGLIGTASRDGYLCLINGNTFKLLQKFHPENPTRNGNACKIAIIGNPYHNLTPEPVSSVISGDNGFDGNDDFSGSTGVSGTNQLNQENNKINEYVKKYGTGKEIVLAIVSGGQDSKFVTTTNAKEGGFDIIIYNAMTGEELAVFLDHFGPVNSLAVHQETLASGAEDSTVRIHEIEHYLFKKENENNGGD